MDDVRIVPLANETVESGLYEVLRFNDFNGSYDHHEATTTSSLVASWLGMLALALLLSSFVVCDR